MNAYCRVAFGMGLSLVAGLLPNAASALLSNTYVDPRAGSDSNTCEQTAPCLTLNQALSQTASGGAVIVLGPGVFGPIFLTQPVNIVGPAEGTLQINANGAAQAGCVGAAAGTCGNNGYAIEIAVGATNTVKLKHLLAGAGSSGNGAIKIDNAFAVQFHRVIGRGNNTTSNAIVTVLSGQGSQLQLSFQGGDFGYNKNGGVMLIRPSGATPVKLHLSGTRIHNAYFGLRMNGQYMSSGSQLMAAVERSEFFSFNLFAYQALSYANTGTVNAALRGSSFFNAGNAGVDATGPNTGIIISDNVIAGNQTGVNIATSAVVNTPANNVIIGNGPNGTNNVVGGPMTSYALQ